MSVRADVGDRSSGDSGAGNRDTVAAIELAQVQKRFKGVVAVQNASFTVPANTIVSLLGRSGCGKTTTLRMIGGLERPDSGRISVHGRLVNSQSPKIAVPPEKRGIGFVFQSYALWPHLTVFEHVAYPLRSQRYRGPLPERVGWALDMVGLNDLVARYPSELSGGQQQRVALARAIVAEPRVLLLDEPFSNLDPELRRRLRADLQSVQAQLGLAIVYVTHDKSDALSLSHRIVVMEAGRVLESGTPRELFETPSHLETARLLRGANVMAATAISLGSGGTELRLEGSAGPVTLPPVPGRAARTGAVLLSIKAEGIRLTTPGDSVISGQAMAIAYLGHQSQLTVKTKAGLLEIIFTDEITVTPGENVHLAFNPGAIAVMPDTDSQTG